MYALDIDGSNQADLTPFDSVQVRIVDDLEEILEEVLSGMNKRDQCLHDVYRLIPVLRYFHNQFSPY